MNWIREYLCICVCVVCVSVYLWCVCVCEWVWVCVWVCVCERERHRAERERERHRTEREREKESERERAPMYGEWDCYFLRPVSNRFISSDRIWAAFLWSMSIKLELGEILGIEKCESWSSNKDSLLGNIEVWSVKYRKDAIAHFDGCEKSMNMRLIS